MVDRFARRLYERLGQRYKLVFLVVQVPATLVVAVLTVTLIASFYEPSLGEFALITVGTGFFATVAIGWALAQSRQFLTLVVAWRDNPAPTEAETLAAWDAATNFPLRSFRRNSLTVSTIAIVPSVALVMAILDLGLIAAPVLVSACIVAAVFSTVFNYTIAEMLMRPVVEDICEAMPDDFPLQRNGLPLLKRVIISVPAFTALAGFIVAAIVTEGGGTGLLALSVASAIGVAAALSFELTYLLARSITVPIADLRRALARVREGDYGARVSVLTSDEIGELSADFNRMARGLAERERIREAFGTYLDKDVAGFILSGQFPDAGVEVDVSILFCDVRDFTPFAEQAAAAEVVSTLNELFETIVPVVERHGGHVDKFIGDGLLAVFGAPEGYADHADRAVTAGLEMIEAANRPDAPLRVAVGINSGRVVAGSIGGAGRLNFSVIGDAVNVAARVEAKTRETGDDLLITAATRDAMTRPASSFQSRGEVALKGSSRPVEVLAPPSPDGLVRPLSDRSKAAR